jgi:hypothetical protein
MNYSDLTKDQSTVFYESQLPENDPSIGTWDDGVRMYQEAKAERDELLSDLRDELYRLSGICRASDRAAVDGVRSATTSEAPTIRKVSPIPTSPTALAPVADQSPAASHNESAPAAGDDLPEMHATYTPGDDKGEFGGFPAW